MTRRPISLLLLVPLLVLPLGLAACGGEDEEPSVDVGTLLGRLQMAEGDELEQLAEQVGARAQEDPEVLDGLVSLLRVDEPMRNMITFEVKLAESDELPDREARSAAMRAATRIMAARLRAHGHPPATFNATGTTGAVTVYVPKPIFPAGMTAEMQRLADRDFGRRVLRHMTAPGHVELLTVVEPPEEGLEPASLWTGSRAAYDAFLEKGAAEIDAAVEAGVTYAPDEPGFLVAAVPPAQGDENHGVVMVHRARNRDGRFGRDDFTLREITLTDSGQVGLELAVAEDRRAAMEAWTTSHLGREVVLVADGVAAVPVRLTQPITDVALIPFGPKDDVGAVSRVRAITRLLVTPAHPHALEGERMRTVGPDAQTPAALALVASGNAGAKRMMALRAEGGDLGARAARILELIARRRTSGGDKFVPDGK